ncbi:streptococcal phage DNAse [Streptococcus equi subsp. equi]|uniref:DNA/RNA non-specific endonuclease n=1 Tax=Streptococcus equi TaxID=1336 RepID=UPI0006599230|nr:DNA/RNA non-specific endonuclease [Streptococcus equi]HEL1065538.1 DNA/RNA non-specific endonuclease [Streptococcus equi subsp. zooepidemicus]MBT1229677.1 DNA/RNA non-specific endonuclease [Streptococcus equi subsp. equi]MBT1231808.1 DNA/RNA non-specific endonuclease [Streptococcus equi subsp. equi]MBT1237096.1 DNA/RNA non-specific endonuclease [Streptococcus equi subsp. equi]MBT1240411.1 DNA/RNA non-specific endonuclease [Streptococcus equi subsp. equi]
MNNIRLRKFISSIFLILLISSPISLSYQQATLADTKEVNVANSYNSSDTYLPEALSWTLETSPNYYKVLGESGIVENLFPPKGQIVYGGLDSLGRTLTVRGTLTFNNVLGSYNIRKDFKRSKAETLSGWLGNKNGEVYVIKGLGDDSYQGYFWNKSHLIADSLGGDALRVNAITGTRTQNVGGRSGNGGMRYTEIKSQKWLEAHRDGYLYYEAMPIYQGNELVPRAVVVSVLSSDNTINEKVIVYNVANGYTIDYNQGTFSANQ